MVVDFLKNFWKGFWSFRDGMRFLRRHPKLLTWCILPVLLNYLVFGTIFYFASRFIPELTAAVLPEATNWFWSALNFLLQGVGFLIVGVASYFLFVPVAGLIASPFNDMLAEQVGILLTGHTPENAGWKNFIGDALFAMGVEVKKLLLLLALAALTFVVGLVPVANVLAPFLGFLTGVFFVALEYIDFSMSQRKLPYSDRVALLAFDAPGATLGFGIPPYVVALIPVLNVLLIPLLAPVLVVAGALLYYEHLAPNKKERTSRSGEKRK